MVGGHDHTRSHYKVTASGRLRAAVLRCGTPLVPLSVPGYTSKRWHSMSSRTTWAQSWQGRARLHRA